MGDEGSFPIISAFGRWRVVIGVMGGGVGVGLGSVSGGIGGIGLMGLCRPAEAEDWPVSLVSRFVCPLTCPAKTAAPANTASAKNASLTTIKAPTGEYLSTTQCF